MTAERRTGLPVSSTLHSPTLKRSDPCTPVRPAKMSAISAPTAPSVLTQNTPFSSTTGLVWLRRLRHISKVGGASDTEHTAVAVAPVLPAGPAVVITCTAAPSRLMASRNSAGSTVRTCSGPTTVKAPSMASSGRWSIQLISSPLLRRALGAGHAGIRDILGIEPGVTAPAILVVFGQALIGK